jgi:hypothetical protein
MVMAYLTESVADDDFNISFIDVQLFIADVATIYRKF